MPDTSTVIATTPGDGTAWITFNKPPANSLDEATGNAFVKALEDCRDTSIRCVVITGEGKAFCTGEDLKALKQGYDAGTPEDLGAVLRRRYLPAITLLRDLRKPVIAAVNGVAAGAGMSIALACDYRIMSKEASFVFAFSQVGVIPDAGGSWLLPRYLGLGRAMELALIGDPITAERAESLGLVGRVCEQTELHNVATELSSRLASGPTEAFALTKSLFWQAHSTDLEEQLEAEAAAQSRAGSTEDHLEAVRAFFDKRRPEFKGK